MLLFIDVDKDKKTGWEGYDYIINLDVISDTVTTLKKWNNEKWVTVKQIDYAYSHDELDLPLINLFSIHRKCNLPFVSIGLIIFNK